MKTNQLFIGIILLFIQFNTLAQNELDINFPLYQFYNIEGKISLKHIGDEFTNGYKQSFLQIHAPFSTTDKQVFSMQSTLQKNKLLSDMELQSKLGLAWKFSFTKDWNLSAKISGSFSEFTTNKIIALENNADLLLQSQQYSNYGVNSSLGLLQKYFWIIGSYEQNFALESQYKKFESNALNATIGGRYIFNDWEFRLPVQAFDLVDFDVNQIYSGLVISYKNNFLYGSVNSQGNFIVEIGLKPYKWLGIGFIYEQKRLLSTSNYGIFGSYHWSAHKLEL